MPNIQTIVDPDDITRKAHVDADGKLLVAGSFSGGGDGAIQDGANSAIEATVLDGATANPLVVTLTDSNGDPVAVGGGTQYTEDAAAAANPVGTALNLIRADALAGLTTTDGDNVAARGTDKGELYVKHADSIVADLGATDNAVLDAIAASVAAIDTDATTIIGHVDGIEGLLTTIDTDTGALVAGQLPDGHAVTVDNAAGAAAVNIQDGGNSITVDGSLTVDLGANNDVTVTSGTIDVIGTVADDATTPGDPVMVGGQAVSPDGTDPTAVAENDVVRFRTDLNRRLYVATNHPRTWHYHLNTSSAQTDTSVQAAPGAGLRLVITNIQFSSGAATAINMFLEEGASTIWGPIYLEAVAGRGYVSGPIFKPVTANTALTLTTSAAIAHSVEILGFIEAV